MKIIVDGIEYKSRAQALREFGKAMCFCDGSEQERMTFAYCSIIGGYTKINTYRDIAE